MKLKIICPDGLTANAKILNAETGEALEGVKKIFIVFDADKALATVILDLVEVGVEVVAELEKPDAGKPA